MTPPTPSTCADEIRLLLHTRFAPIFLEVKDESAKHASHHKTLNEKAGGHFEVTLVSEAFAGLSLLARHRQVYACLGELLAGPIHALALHTYAPGEKR